MWPFCQHLSPTDSQCLDREGVAVSRVEWFLPLTLQNRALWKQTVVTRQRRPSEQHPTITARRHTGVGRRSNLSLPQLHTLWPFRDNTCLQSGVKCIIVTGRLNVYVYVCKARVETQNLCQEFYTFLNACASTHGTVLVKLWIWVEWGWEVLT